MKNFLKKLFGGGEGTSGYAQHKQRSPRVRIPSLDKAVFVSSNGRSFPLRNLSETGLALMSQGDRFPDEVSGTIHVGQEKVHVELLVVRRAGDEVGVNFANDPSELRGLLRRVFGDEIQAQTMSEVDPEHQKRVELGQPRWYYAPGNYELFYVEHEGKVVRFELEWNGNLLVFADKALRFGKIDRKGSHDQDKVKHAQSSLVSWADQVRGEDRTKALRLLENIKELEAPHREQMQAMLQG